MEKTCSNCKLSKSSEKFSKKRNKLQPWCKECNNSRSKQYYSDNKISHKKTILERKRKTIAENQYKINKIKRMIGCICCCNESEPICLDFHHLGDKDERISVAIRNCWSWDRLVREIKKCILVCSNCHRKIHAGLIESPMLDWQSTRLLNGDYAGSTPAGDT